MKRVALLLFLAGWLVPLASAQDHFQAGAYFDYLRLSQTNSNMAGLGGRIGVKVFSHVMLEAEMNYDFKQAFSEGFTDNSVVPPTVQVVNSNLKVLHGLVGPKFVAGRGRIHPFITVKGGFVNFRLDPQPGSVAGFLSSVNNLRANNVSGTLYPAAGLEGNIGPIGLRLEAGDEIYFSGGTHHNVRVAFGPYIRF